MPGVLGEGKCGDTPSLATAVDSVGHGRSGDVASADVTIYFWVSTFRQLRNRAAGLKLELELEVGVGPEKAVGAESQCAFVSKIVQEA